MIQSHIQAFLSLFALAIGGLFLPVRSQAPRKPLILPTKYVADRFYLEPISVDGVKLTFYTDTGGGLFIYREAAERLHLRMVNKGSDSDPFYVAALPQFKPAFSIPPPLSREGQIPVFAPSAKEREASQFVVDGMLGQEWFAGRVWTFDYPRRRLLLRAAGDAPIGKGHRIRLGFRTDDKGQRDLNFPRIQVSVEGEMLDLLFDTGATTALSDSALAVLRDQEGGQRATSFITSSIFEKWRKQHPNWRVIEQAEKTTGEAMIEVPRLTVAGYSVGPIWFTRRADKSFHEFMSKFMDKRVEGALGGNALHYFRITVDYPNALATFEK